MPRYIWDINTHLLFDDEQLVLTNPHIPTIPPGPQGANLYWELWIDLQGDGKFAGPNDRIPLEDVVMPMSWQLGLDPEEQMARPATATILLDNSTGKYSPERDGALAGFTTHRAIKLVSGGYPFAKTDAEGNFTGETYSVVTEQTMFLLRIDSIEPEPNRYSGKQITRIKAADMLPEAGMYSVSVPLQLDKYASEILRAAVREDGLYPPGTVFGWILGYTPLGETRLGIISDPFNFDFGAYQYPYAMDNNDINATLYDVIRYVVETENGRFFTNRAGQLEFWDRNHMSLHTDVDYTIDNDMIAMTYKYGAEIANIVRVRYQRREITLTGTPVLATTVEDIQIPEGATVVTVIEFRDASGNRVSSSNPIKPVPGTDYYVTSNYGYDYTSQVDLTMKATAQSAELTLKNNFVPAVGFSGDLFIPAGMTIRGTDRVIAYPKNSVKVEDADSIFEFGRRPYKKVVDLKFVDTYALAMSIAQEIRDKYAQPRGNAVNVKFAIHDAATWTLALKGVIGSRIMILETQTGHSQEYFVVGESHSIRDGGGSDYTLALTLEPVGSL
ncbi:MAG: hypothetical protein JXB07_18860 [Anaerolineae bacterium]|nr:hypothetical protein [Anaerolineae bacterium]